MHSHHEEDPEALEKARRLRWEPRDLGLKGIRRGTEIYIVFTTVGIIASLGILQGVVLIMGRGDMTGPSQQEMSRETLPKSPLLQSNVTVKTDMIELRKREDKALNSYGRDPKTGHYHIPVDKAIDELGKTGLPAGGQL